MQFEERIKVRARQQLDVVGAVAVRIRTPAPVNSAAPVNCHTSIMTRFSAEANPLLTGSPYRSGRSRPGLDRGRRPR